MTKQLRVVTNSRIVIDDWTKENYSAPQLPRCVYSRHFRRRAKYRYKSGTAIIEILHGWYIHSHRTGARILSALPF